MKKRVLLIIFLFLNLTLYAQMTIWNNSAFIVLEAEDYNDRIKKPQFVWNDTYYAVGIEGNVITDEMLRTYFFSYMDNSGYAMDYSEIDKIYEEIQDFANGYTDEKTLHCYFYDDHFCYIVFFRIVLKKGQKIVVKQDATYIPVKQNY